MGEMGFMLIEYWAISQSIHYGSSLWNHFAQPHPMSSKALPLTVTSSSNLSSPSLYPVLIHPLTCPNHLNLWLSIWFQILTSPKRSLNSSDNFLYFNVTLHSDTHITHPYVPLYAHSLHNIVYTVLAYSTWLQVIMIKYSITCTLSLSFFLVFAAFMLFSFIFPVFVVFRLLLDLWPVDLVDLFPKEFSLSFRLAWNSETAGWLEDWFLLPVNELVWFEELGSIFDWWRESSLFLSLAVVKVIDLRGLRRFLVSKLSLFKLVSA